MFRTALLRTARAAAPRTLTHTPRVALPRMALHPVTIRMYSASSLKKDEVEGRIMSLLQGFDKVNDTTNIKPVAHFANDLGLDSLDTVEVVMAIEEEFSIEIPDKDADTIHSVDKAVEYILSQPDAH
ncbi:Acyl carrier protein-like protein [Metarhizium rileyi]|uniref:Acyl carrier protein n=1 Tax=Metarhizium rileyi (strain RCEF 4871) TaxID=1649241 RepID=A0A166Y115_METRR|nr:Acyl carrier protein-like protein [Metarhizium rileyi RCEF 4871]TWU72671.1 hypothetical protein ED733_002916 [Metarhizium rileyi]